MPQEKSPAAKEPTALFWILIGLLGAIGCMIGIERLVGRY